MIKTKLKAFLLHFILSAVVISLIFSILLLFWFPSPFLGLTHFKEIAYLLIAIDVVLGPLLTFVVYNPNKKSLRFDLTSIVTIQILALSYGIYTLFLAHPVYITYFDGRYNIVTAKQAQPHQTKYSSLKISKLSSPTFAFMDIPDKNTMNALFTDMLNGSVDIEARAEYYKPYKTHWDKIILNSLNPNTLLNNKKTEKKLNYFLKKNKQPIESYTFVPINGTNKDAILILEKSTGKAVDILDVPLYLTENSIPNEE